MARTATARATATRSDSSRFVEDTAPVVTQAGAEATAVGDATLATGSVTVNGADLGKVTVVKGVVEASAYASGGGVFTDAGTFVFVEGADLVFSRTIVRSSEDGSGTTSKVYFTAVDFEAFNFASGPKFIESFTEGTLRTSVAVDDYIARVEAYASASGTATSVTVLTDAYVTVGSSDITGYAEVIIA